MPDDLSATLAGISQRSEWASDRYAEMGVVRESADDVPVLVAAVEAALKAHRPIDRGRVMRCCEGCELHEAFHDDCCHEWPCPTYRAITAELTGKE